jgi:hypothetical protein
VKRPLWILAGLLALAAATGLVLAGRRSSRPPAARCRGAPGAGSRRAPTSRRPGWRRGCSTAHWARPRRGRRWPWCSRGRAGAPTWIWTPCDGHLAGGGALVVAYAAELAPAPAEATLLDALGAPVEAVSTPLVAPWRWRAARRELDCCGRRSAGGAPAPSWSCTARSGSRARPPAAACWRAPTGSRWRRRGLTVAGASWCSLPSCCATRGWERRRTRRCWRPCAAGCRRSGHSTSCTTAWWSRRAAAGRLPARLRPAVRAARAALRRRGAGAGAAVRSRLARGTAARRQRRRVPAAARPLAPSARPSPAGRRAAAATGGRARPSVRRHASAPDAGDPRRRRGAGGAGAAAGAARWGTPALRRGPEGGGVTEMTTTRTAEVSLPTRSGCARG